VKKTADFAREAARIVGLKIQDNIATSAEKHNWPKDAANAVKVDFESDKYSLDIRPKKLEGKVMDLEYGTNDSRPTAAVRKATKNTTRIENLFVKTLEEKLGWKL
jgi:hypothetical protein